MNENADQNRQESRIKGASFAAGFHCRLLRESISWLQTSEHEHFLSPRQVKCLDLPDDCLSPFSGTQSDLLLRRRAIFLQRLATISETLERLDTPDDCPEYRPVCELMVEFAGLFDRLGSLEIQNSPENQRHLDVAVIRSILEECSQIESSVQKLLNELDEWLDRLFNQIPENCRAIFALGKEAAELKLEIESFSESDADLSNSDIGDLHRRVNSLIAKANQSLPHPSDNELESPEFSLQGVSQRFESGLKQIHKGFGSPSQQNARPEVRHSFPRHPDVEEPADADGWEKLTKSPVRLCGITITGLQHQQALTLSRLLFIPGYKCTAGDIRLALGDKAPDTQESRQRISSIITKLEQALSRQLGVTVKPASPSDRGRIIQRGLGHEQQATYSISIEQIEKLVDKSV